MIRLKNTKEIVSANHREAKTLIEETKGLLFEEKPSTLVLNTRLGIHTIGLKFPIDVVILDKNLKIVSIKKNLKPNRVYFWHPKYSKAIEMEKGTIDMFKLKVGNELEIL